MIKGKRLFTITQILFIISIAVQFLPDKTDRPGNKVYAVGLILFIAGIQVLTALFMPEKSDYKTWNGVFGFVFGFIAIWTLLTAKINLIPQDIFKSPDIITAQFLEDRPRLLVDLKKSLITIIEGYGLALLTAIPLGLFLGWNQQIGKISEHIANFFGSIPPVVFIPYAIALLPTFESCSVFVIFITAFWPILSGTTSGVRNVSTETINSAKVMCVSPFTMLFKVLLPASLPQVFDGCNMGLLMSFILLTSAEMIGGNSGIGFYIQYYTNFGNFTRIMVGIIFLGIIVTLITNLVKQAEEYLLRWKK